MKDDNNSRPTNNKILSIDKHHRSRKETDVSNLPVHQLLNHMRQVRESVPVNRQLQEELRRNLLRKEKHINGNQSAHASTVSKEQIISRFPKWILAVFLSIVSVLGVFALWYKQADTVLQPVGSPETVTRVWNVDTNLSYSLSPGGDILVARHGQLLYVEQSRGRYRLLDLPADWMYHSPSFSPDGNKVAMVRLRQGIGPQIVVLSASKLVHGQTQELQMLVNGESDQQFRHLEWSPGGKKLAYTEIDKNGVARVKTSSLKGETELVTRGMHPTWSPDGTKLVVQRGGAESDGTLYLVDIVKGQELELGPGEQPFWGQSGFLAYVVARQQERVLTFMPDGSPQFTVRQRVGEIRSIFAGDDGGCLAQITGDVNNNWLTSSTLLVSPGDEVSGRETEWLRKLELEGVREPRVLLLDGVKRCQDPVFNVQGDRLFFTRQDQGAAAVLRLNLEERLPKRGEN